MFRAVLDLVFIYLYLYLFVFLGSFVSLFKRALGPPGRPSGVRTS
jgi:hypothetical protein